MRLAIVAVGRLKDGPERELFQRYWSRLDGMGKKLALAPLTLTELVESRAGSPDTRRNEEATRLIAAVPPGEVIALDETGRGLSSDTFATELRRRRDAGINCVTFLLGGPDGHGAAVRARASLTLSLGPMTLPHGLARVVLAEQLYRSATLIAGHPYHRA